VADVASVIGDIEIGGNSNVWPATVMRDNSCRIIVATNANLEDICAVHGLAKIVM